MEQIKLNLVDLVASIRDELERVDKARIVSGKATLFHLNALELELNFVVEENSAVKGGFDIKVLSLGGDAGVRTEQIHKVKLTFDVPSEARTVLGARAHGSSSLIETEISPIE